MGYFGISNKNELVLQKSLYKSDKSNLPRTLKLLASDGIHVSEAIVNVRSDFVFLEYAKFRSSIALKIRRDATPTTNQ